MIFPGIAQFAAVGFKVDRQFPVDVDGNLGTGIDKHRIVALRLAFGDPVGQFIRPAGGDGT